MSYSQGVKWFMRSGLGWSAALLVMSCATTQLTSSWKDPDYNRGPLKKVVVFAVHDDAAVRRAAEDQAVAHIPVGTQAVASYTLFEKLARGEREKIKARLIEEGFDGAMVTRLIEISKSETYVPPHTYTIPSDPRYGAVPHYNSFDNYYSYVQGEVHTTPEFVREDTTAKIETILYTLPDSELIWSGISERVNPRSAKKVAHELAELIAKELVGHGIVGSASGKP